jgi:hypothetical protein
MAVCFFTTFMVQPIPHDQIVVYLQLCELQILGYATFVLDTNTLIYVLIQATAGIGTVS